MSKNPLEGFSLKTRMVKIEDIDTNTFVRTGIDQNRVELMGLAVEGG